MFLKSSLIQNFSLPVSDVFDVTWLPSGPDGLHTALNSLVHHDIALSNSKCVHLCVDVCGVKCVSIRVVHIFHRLQKCSSLAGCLQQCGLEPWPRSPPKPKPKPELEMAVKPTTGPCCIQIGRRTAASLKPCLQRAPIHICGNRACMAHINKGPERPVALFFSPSLLDRHQSNNVMFWFKIRGGTLLEMTSLLLPQFDCLQSQRRESVFSFYWFGFETISIIEMDHSAVIVSDCMYTV